MDRGHGRRHLQHAGRNPIGRREPLLFLLENVIPAGRKLVDTLPVKKGSRDESEFQMVASTVQQLSERAKDYETQLHSQSDLLAASLTTRVLKGEIFLSPDIAEALRQGGFPIACQKFVVLILSIDEDADAESPPIQQEEAGAF